MRACGRRGGVRRNFRAHIPRVIPNDALRLRLSQRDFIMALPVLGKALKS